MPKHGQAAVVVENLVVRRGRLEVLHGLSCELPPGQVTGLLGPSGGGKTTLMRSIVGVQRVVSGRVTVLGEPAGSRDLRHRLGYVTQAPSIYGDATVLQNVSYFAQLAGASRARVAEVISQVGLDSHASALATRLSGGQASRASLACALVGDPELLVLDEPTVGLDPLLREDLWRLFHELSDAGHTLLVSSHVMDEARRCDRLLLLREGRLVADATPGELAERTGTDDLEQAFLRLIRAEEVA
ncbi:MULTISPECIES: ABC transporter ATP-binding protein [Aestuariimicrobium]|uniref:ABC transporter ATP-binding protein n=1 Tax=Aestuariimicrobium TaxID=396388 RepID=UPI0003B3A672|nr:MULTISPECIES: ABC transporter ATP-binding protein [Aestuariimicrobium]CAI9400591.1 Ribosome-associated ATPase [Aestuariimicrobium sp. T2.26MG-19.2B]